MGKVPARTCFSEKAESRQKAVCWWGMCDFGRLESKGTTQEGWDFGVPLENQGASPGALKSSLHGPKANVLIKARLVNGSRLLNREDLETENRKRGMSLVTKGRSLSFGGWCCISFPSTRKWWFEPYERLVGSPHFPTAFRTQEWSQVGESEVANIVSWMWHGKLAWPQMTFKRLRFQRALPACTLISHCQCCCLLLWSL